VQKSTLLKVVLSFVFVLACLVLLSSDALARGSRGGSRGGSRPSVRNHNHRHNHRHHHRHRHHRHRHHRNNGGDVDGGDGDGGGDVGDGDDGAEAVEMEAAEYGVKILELAPGVACNKALNVGDIILSYNGVRTPSIDALAAAVQGGGGTARVLVLRADGGERQTLTLAPVLGRIGVTGQGVRVEDDDD
jgi:hypothetical protein